MCQPEDDAAHHHQHVRKRQDELKKYFVYILVSVNSSRAGEPEPEGAAYFWPHGAGAAWKKTGAGEVVCEENYIFPNLTNSQEPKLQIAACFCPLELEPPKEKKGARAALEKN